MAQAELALRSLAHHRKRLGQELVQRLSGRVALLELVGLGAQLLVAQFFAGRLKRVDTGGNPVQLARDALVVTAKQGLQGATEHRSSAWVNERPPARGPIAHVTTRLYANLAGTACKRRGTNPACHAGATARSRDRNGAHGPDRALPGPPNGVGAGLIQGRQTATAAGQSRARVSSTHGETRKQHAWSRSPWLQVIAPCAPGLGRMRFVRATGATRAYAGSAGPGVAADLAPAVARPGPVCRRAPRAPGLPGQFARLGFAPAPGPRPDPGVRARHRRRRRSHQGQGGGAVRHGGGTGRSKQFDLGGGSRASAGGGRWASGSGAARHVPCTGCASQPATGRGKLSRSPATAQTRGAAKSKSRLPAGRRRTLA